ncbi:MAG TPA: hypothetical protein VJV79_14495 [Polyangiaceae bacterium]|nr:hypothetical protein [Polyangiaceae bacterium]
MRRFKFAVLRARHDPNEAFIPEQACLEMMMNNEHHTSVLNYWTSVTNGHLDFVGSTLFPWVDIQPGADNFSRHTQCARAYAATKLIAGDELDQFDGYAVLTHPGRLTVSNPLFGQPNQPSNFITGFDGGAGAVVNDKPACALPVMTSNHTFMCHELGHVLGFLHSYGVVNNGVDWNGVAPFEEGPAYGDPYDIMSSASFGTRNLDPELSIYRGNPTFVGWSVPGWPNLGAFGMGPPPARAHLHFWDAQAFAPERIRHFQAPFVGEKLRVTLTAAGRANGVQLVVLHPVGEDGAGRGRVYIEYRQKGGWDEGLDLNGSDLARQGVVVHALADTSEGLRCWYRGRVLVPLELDSDVSVANTPLQVRVLEADVENGTVDVEISAKLERGVEIHARGTHRRITVINPRPMWTPCGDPITYGTWITETHVVYQPVSFGFGSFGAPDATLLVARWTVGGVPIVGNDGTLQVPTTDGVFTVFFELHPVTAELVLWSRGGERYGADVTVAVSESDGSGTGFAAARFEPNGWYDGLGPGDNEKLERCMFKYAKSARLRPRDLLIPPGPDPYFHPHIDHSNQRRMQHFIDRIADSHPAEASALSAMSALRYGVRNH